MARTKKHSHPIEIDWRLKKIKDGFNIQIKDPYLGIFWITKKTTQSGISIPIKY